jgi:hypothetical protein
MRLTDASRQRHFLFSRPAVKLQNSLFHTGIAGHSAGKTAGFSPGIAAGFSAATRGHD